MAASKTTKATATKKAPARKAAPAGKVSAAATPTRTRAKPRAPTATGKAGAAGRGSGRAAVEADHSVTEGQPVTYMTAGHPPRSESKTYVRSRAALVSISKAVNDWYFGGGPYQDHHGGGLWVHDGDGWFFLRNLVGIEWSGQFCADPAKIDALRRNAARLYARFPESFKAFSDLGIDLKALLDKPIADAAGVAEWTDSICNASVPLPQPFHTGTVPKGGGVHHYPTPVTDIDRFRRDDFTLWVTDAEGQPAAVVPRAPLGSADRSVRVVHSTPGTALHRRHSASEAKGQHHELAASHPMARAAFKNVAKP